MGLKLMVESCPICGRASSNANVESGLCPACHIDPVGARARRRVTMAQSLVLIIVAVGVVVIICFVAETVAFFLEWWGGWLHKHIG
jgi:hypothetical protein